jgi:nicotinamidase-related amidase
MIAHSFASRGVTLVLLQPHGKIIFQLKKSPPYPTTTTTTTTHQTHQNQNITNNGDPTNPFNPNPTDKSTPGYYLPSQTALLLLDFHSFFVQKAVGSAALANAAHIRDWAHHLGIQVIHCLIDINLPPFPTAKDSDKLAGVVAAMKTSGGDKEPAELLDESNGVADVTFTRRAGYVSALKSPGLEEFLSENGIRSLVLTGLSTSRCVLRTACAPCDAEFVTTVISDECADPIEGVHDLLVGKVLGNRSFVISADEFEARFCKVRWARWVEVF